MAVWLGEAGGIRLERAGGERLYANISPSDVDVAAGRFGFDRPVTALITGDAVWIRRVDAEGVPSALPLDFAAPAAWADGKQYGDGRWFVHVDGIGGVRLYRDWSDAIAGKSAKALPLQVPAAAMRVSIEIDTGDERCLAHTVSWELNTNREVADVSALGDGFRKNYGTMVSGSGSLDCLFDLGLGGCDPSRGGDDVETSIYLHRLVLRQEIGARFKGVFLLKAEQGRPLGSVLSAVDARRELFYACDCVVTGVACSLEATKVIHSKIDFVTTGPIQLLFGLPSGYLLQESTGKVLQESGFGILLELPTD
jgi:hypothetical protein